eukprot:TRINITY_DN4097_c0_g1_i1.p1 TRINITY_DN4097_c0_g1~~TRINITY_DN4097_c0_g1_i1.p1  ORF type:complete len:537 (-),score=66.91 TRINITY_DN4097_c0_g1_i1:216-1748(-)
MREIAKKAHPIEKYSISKEEAIKHFGADELKQEVLKKIPDESVSIYRQGEFEDLCRGPHLPNLKYLKHFKLTKLAGAYLGGDEKNEMLQRIYGIAFATKDALKDHLKMLEEAKKRDHRKLGSELKLFTFDEQIGGGLPIWLPNGAKLRAKLEEYLSKLHREAGYQIIRGPELIKSDLWKISGHYQNYKENMYFTEIDDNEYGIKPMNCLGHIKVYESDVRSYRELPIRLFEYGVVHRHEKSGVLHGLLRVREFTQDDAHIFCTRAQIKQVIGEILDFIEQIMQKFGFSYEIEISTRPEKAIGEVELWDEATEALKEALDEKEISYGLDEGGGAFYGPKIDVKITDCIGRKWQCSTVQLDFNLPERFDLEYVDENNQRVRPVMIHRAVLGSFERFIAVLIEHFAGEMPFFLAPRQLVIVPIAEAHQEYAEELKKELFAYGVDAEIDYKNESLNKRIRNAETSKVPMIAVIGGSEVEESKVSFRDRREQKRDTLSKEDFIKLIKEKLSEGNI